MKRLMGVDEKKGDYQECSEQVHGICLSQGEIGVMVCTYVLQGVKLQYYRI